MRRSICLAKSICLLASHASVPWKPGNNLEKLESPSRVVALNVAHAKIVGIAGVDLLREAGWRRRDGSYESQLQAEDQLA